VEQLPAWHSDPLVRPPAFGAVKGLDLRLPWRRYRQTGSLRAWFQLPSVGVCSLPQVVDCVWASGIRSVEGDTALGPPERLLHGPAAFADVLCLR